MGTIRVRLTPRQGKAPGIGLNLKGLGRQPYLMLGTMAGPVGVCEIEGTGLTDRSPSARLERYFKWLPAPMKKSMGIESMKLIREANKAVRPHCAISAGAGVPCAAAVTAAMIFFWFGQMTA